MESARLKGNPDAIGSTFCIEQVNKDMNQAHVKAPTYLAVNYLLVRAALWFSCHDLGKGGQWVLNVECYSEIQGLNRMGVEGINWFTHIGNRR